MNPVFNVGAETPYTVLQFARGVEPRVVHLPHLWQSAFINANF